MLPANVDNRCCLLLVVLYNKSLNDCSLGKQLILLPSNTNVSFNFRLGKHWDSRELKLTVSLRGNSHKVFNVANFYYFVQFPPIFTILSGSRHLGNPKILYFLSTVPALPQETVQCLYLDYKKHKRLHQCACVLGIMQNETR